jgi:hypothetical protein
MRYFVGKIERSELSGLYLADILVRDKNDALLHIFKLPHGLIHGDSKTGDEIYFRSVVTKRCAVQEKLRKAGRIKP